MLRMRLLAAVAAAAALAMASGVALPAPAVAGSCSLHYVAAGDDFPAGNGTSEEESYAGHLLKDHLEKVAPWCKYGKPKNETTSSSYISDGQMALAWNMAPDLITLSVGEQNSGIKEVIETCFEDIKSHDFSGANECAAEALADVPAYEEIEHNLSTILDNYMRIMAGRPELVVAVVGYPDPYPSFESAEESVPEFCVPLVDTITNCLTRWEQFPPALELIDQVFKKLNSTLAKEVSQFTEGSQGRFVFVDPSSFFTKHCMKMEVDIQTQVSHGDEVIEEDTEKNFGCENPFWVEGSLGAEPPTYLEPAESGVLVGEEQETTGMGIHPNNEGQSCIAELIWEAVKIQLGVAQAPGESVCEGQTDATASEPAGSAADKAASAAAFAGADARGGGVLPPLSAPVASSITTPQALRRPRARDARLCLSIPRSKRAAHGARRRARLGKRSRCVKGRNSSKHARRAEPRSRRR